MPGSLDHRLVAADNAGVSQKVLKAMGSVEIALSRDILVESMEPGTTEQGFERRDKMIYKYPLNTMCMSSIASSGQRAGIPFNRFNQKIDFKIINNLIFLIISRKN